MSPPASVPPPTNVYLSLVDAAHLPDVFATTNYCYGDNHDPLSCLGPLSVVNVFIGANNSGKSRLMRGISAMQGPELIDSQAIVLLEEWARQLRAMSGLPLWVYLVPIEMRFGEIAKKSLATSAQQLAASLEKLAKNIQLLPQVLRSLPHHQAQLWGLDSTSGGQARLYLKPFLDQAFSDLKRFPNRGSEPEGYDDFLASPLWIILDTARHQGMSFYANPGSSVDLSHLPDLRVANLTKMCHFPTPGLVYIPVLRTAHSILTGDKTRLEANAYEHTVRSLYNVRREIDVFTGLNLYEQFLSERSGKRVLRERFAAFEEFLGRHFFKSQSIDIVSEYTRILDEQHIRVKIGDSPDHQLHHLGDGINALILLVYRIFMADSETWFFIEEPETHLHPGLQRIFIETLLTDSNIRTKALRFFFTTHSNHLLELAMTLPEEVSVFSLIPNGHDGKPQVSNSQGPDLRVLDELGVHNASVLLANCSIWVEGPSDRYYISAYLAAYATAHPEEVMREDIEYAYFEYAGSNLQHYVFARDSNITDDEIRKIRAQFIANRVFLLADHDHNKDAKHGALFDLQQPPAFVYATTTPAIEIENLLAPAILKKVLPRIFKDRAVRARLKPDELVFDDQALLGTRLGTYLYKVLSVQLENDTPTLFKKPEPSKENPTRHANADALGQTLVDRWKDKLAREVHTLATEGTLEWAMLSDVAQDLTRKIVSFIRSNAR